MKRIVSLIIVLSMILSGTCTVFAEDLNEDKLKVVEPINFSNEIVNKLSEIPIYMTYINDNNISLDNIKESVSSELENAKQASLKNEPLKVVKNAYTISEISASSKADIINNPVYSSTFSRAKDLIEQGVEISNINFFVNDPNLMASANNLDDPAYWEENYALFGNYSGYVFRYYESSMKVESGWVTPGNISPSLKWDAIAKKSIETVLDHYVKDVFVGSVRSTLNTLSTFFGMFTAPISVTYGSSGGSLEAKVSGNLYMRTIFIQDKLDRFPGYAYYKCGSVEMFRSRVGIEATWPISSRPGGTTYNYGYGLRSLDEQTSATIGFYGGSQATLSSMLSLYKNTNGYYQHNERIDHMSIIANLLN